MKNLSRVENNEDDESLGKWRALIESKCDSFREDTPNHNGKGVGPFFPKKVTCGATK